MLIIETMLPVTIKMAADAMYRLVPSNRSINERSLRVQTPIENTITPPTCLFVWRNALASTLGERLAQLIRADCDTYKDDRVCDHQRVLDSLAEALDHGDVDGHGG